MVPPSAEMLDEEQRRLAAFGIAPTTIGEAVPIDLDEAGRCREMRVGLSLSRMS